jgi:hypothetical protein
LHPTADDDPRHGAVEHIDHVDHDDVDVDVDNAAGTDDHHVHRPRTAAERDRHRSSATDRAAEHVDHDVDHVDHVDHVDDLDHVDFHGPRVA